MGIGDAGLAGPSETGLRPAPVSAMVSPDNGRGPHMILTSAIRAARTRMGLEALPTVLALRPFTPPSKAAP